MTRAPAHALRPAQSQARPRRAEAVESWQPAHPALTAWSFSSVPVTTTTASNESGGTGASERAAAAEPQQRTGATSTEEAAA